MITNILSILSGQGGGSSAPPIPISTRHRVLIYLGQSNAINVLSQSENLPTYLQGNIGTVQLRNNQGSGWVNLGSQYAPPPDHAIWSHHFTGEINYGYLMTSFWQGSVYNDYIIKYASSGKAISWFTGNTAMYTFINNALASISANENDYSVVMYWDQHESDADQGMEAESLAYAANWDIFETEFLATVNLRKCPVLLRRGRIPFGVPYWKNIQDQQNIIFANDTNVAEIPCQDIIFPDELHFDEPGSIEIGKRIMEKAIYLFD